MSYNLNLKMSQMKVQLSDDPSIKKTLNSRAPPALNVILEDDTVP